MLSLSGCRVAQRFDPFFRFALIQLLGRIALKGFTYQKEPWATSKCKQGDKLGWKSTRRSPLIFWHNGYWRRFEGSLCLAIRASQRQLKSGKSNTSFGKIVDFRCELTVFPTIAATIRSQKIKLLQRIKSSDMGHRKVRNRIILSWKSTPRTRDFHSDQHGNCSIGRMQTKRRLSKTDIYCYN